MASPFNIGGRSIRPDDLVGIVRDILARLDVVERVSAVAANPTGDISLVFSQTTPATTWTINHSMGKFPDVTIVDTSNNVVWATVNYPSSSQVVVTFSAAMAGKAYLN